jgi:pyruvate,water dikinase
MLGAAGRSDPLALLTVQKRLRTLVGDADAAALTSGITVDGEMLASLGPVVGLAQLERGDIDEATYAERYGHRGPHEFEVSLPRPAEQPGWVDQQLTALREAGADPLGLLQLGGPQQVAVVGCGNATSVLRTGDRVRVDGSRGTVEVLTPAR